jgi:hypothetical protein
MISVRVIPTNKDRYVGAMAKALAVEVAGFAAVGGATHESMFSNGFYLLKFSNPRHLDEFKGLVNTYIPMDSVRIEEV